MKIFIKTFKILGLLVLTTPVVVFFISKCRPSPGIIGDISCAGGTILSGFFSVLASLLFFSVAHILKKIDKGEKVFIVRSKKTLIIKVFLGIFISGFGFLLNILKFDGLDFLLVIGGFYLFIISVLEFFLNKFKKTAN